MVAIQQWTVTKAWAEPHCALGEGPFYEAETDSLRLVDIKKKQIVYFENVSAPENKESATGQPEIVQLDVCPTVTADIEGVDPRERILVGVKYGLATLDRKAKGKYEILVPFHEPRNERLRSNDGYADPLGRFLLGCMTDFGQGPFQPEGGLFLFTKDTKQEIIPNLTIPNGTGWSPDLRTMYFTHSPTRQLFAFDYDPLTGSMSNKRLHYQHTTGPAEPDGLRVDVEGHIWQAFYGEGMVLRIDGLSGEVIGKITVPTRNATCVQFVGEDLFITTAADDDENGEEGGESRRFGGAVFKVNVGVRGMDLFKFEMEN